MPRQSLLRLIKRWKRYELRAKWSDVPPGIRGLYVLYRKRRGTRDRAKCYEVTYIGVAGISATRRGSVRARLKSHDRNKPNWTHFSFFEVHDNITRDEIREIEALLLGIFHHDPRIDLTNKQNGSSKLTQLRRLSHWKDK